jgi:hypothetical protein
MEKLLSAFRLFVAFLLGLLFGAIGTLVMLSQGWGISEFVVLATPQVKELREGLARVESERNDMTRQLENVTSVLQHVEKRYEDLGRRFESLEAALQSPRAPAPRQPPDEASSPTGRVPGAAAIPDS